MSNKNKSGIDNFLNSQKLFQRDRTTSTKLGPGHKMNQYINSARSTASKNYQYNLLNQSMRQHTNQIYETPQQKSNINQQSNISNSKVIDQSRISINNNVVRKLPINQSQSNQNQLNSMNTKQTSYIKSNLYRQQIQIRNSQYLEPKTIQKPKQKSRQKSKPKQSQNLNITRSNSPELYQNQAIIENIPLEQHSSTAWQSLVTKSSRKYFDSCRGQASNYLQKLQKILSKDKIFLLQSLNKIKNTLQDSHTIMAEKLKQYLYRIVDDSVEKWKIQSIQKFNKIQINYIGELLQLNTQVQERYKQILAFKNDLDDEKYWKNRASDLLTTNYQEDLIQLSKLCKKSVQYSQENIKSYLDSINAMMISKVGDRQFSYKLSQKICQCLQNKKKQEEKPQIKTDIKTEKKNLPSSNFPQVINCQNCHGPMVKNESQPFVNKISQT